MTAVFVTGTDTGIGKTWVRAGRGRARRAAGLDAVGMKPVASGCSATPAGWRNDDALALLEAGGLPEADYPLVNPVALPLPASPHLAAVDAGTVIDLAPIEAALRQLRARHALVVVEGVGGWCVPLSGPPGPWLLQDALVRRLRLPVLLVVGLRLGCINHAVLSARAIAADGAGLVGWIGNALAPDWDQQLAVLATLQALLPAPLLGCVGHGGEPGPDLLTRLRAVLAPATA
jgi:dethiobiotin synthetase